MFHAPRLLGLCHLAAHCQLPPKGPRSGEKAGLRSFQLSGQRGAVRVERMRVNLFLILANDPLAR